MAEQRELGTKQQFNVCLPPGLIRQLKHVTVDRAVPLSAFVEVALTDYLDRTAPCVGSALALSIYLIRPVNLPLLLGDEPLSEPDRAQLVTTGHRVIVVRLAALAGTSALLSRYPHVSWVGWSA